MLHKVKVFVSYSHIDEKWKDKLQGHLSFLAQYGDMAEIWQDRKITGGSESDPMISKALQDATIILLLVSSDFLKSNYCYHIEFKEAMKKHENEEAVVIPVIVRDVHWQWREKQNVKGLIDLNALPTDGRAITNRKRWSSDDEGFTVVAKGIEQVVIELTSKLPIDATNLTQAQKVAKKLFAAHSEKSSYNGAPATRSPHLYDALLNLNYIEQKANFGKFLASGHQIGAFLLNGSYECGQDWILHRLLKQDPDLDVRLTTSLRIPFVFTPQRCGRNLGDLWEELALQTGQDATKPENIVDALYASWQTTTVLLILRGVEYVEEAYLQDFITKLWYPLAKKKPPAPPHYCLMFLIDGKGSKWKFAQRFDTTWQPYIPIDLGKLTKFSMAELRRWRPGEVGRLPASITIERILENSDNGLPEPVLKNICRLCGDNWIRRVREWNPY